jgi:transcriptional regulator with GAF, ATPase, and Fis domain
VSSSRSPAVRRDDRVASGHGLVDLGLADRLSELARTLEQQPDAQLTLDAIVQAAVETVPGAEHASISVIRRRREVETRASTDEFARAVDQAQYDSGHGPCLDALYDEATVRLPDLTAEPRWPRFVRAATGLGVGSMLAVQLFVVGDDLGALNLSSREPSAFDDESEHVALLFASHAAVAMSSAQEQALLRKAVSTRQLIGQAQGVLMERFKITDEQAFTLLVRVSQDRNRKLTAIADQLVHSGELPVR